jgi:signal peptidase
MKLLRQIGKYLTLAIYAVCGIALLTFMVPATGLQAKSVATGSMHPAIPTGSLVIIQKTPISQLAVGDIVTYKKGPGSPVTITHRIVEAEKKAGIPFFITKGDANPGPDPAVPGGMIIGKVIFHLPYVGAVTSAIKAPVALLLIVILPGLLIIIVESHRLRRLLRKPAGNPDADPADHNVPPSEPPVGPPSPPAQARRPPVAAQRRGLDGVRTRRLIVLGLTLSAFGVGTTQASITTNKASLVGTKLTVATANPSPSTSPCPAGTTITHTGPGSASTVTCTNTTTTNSTNTNVVTITNTNQQSATTGNVTSTGNTTSATSGGATNDNTTSSNASLSNF